MAYDGQEEQSVPVLENIEMEAAILGACIFDVKAIHRIEFLKPEHFTHEVHQVIYGFVLKRFNAGKNVDGRIVAQYLRSIDSLDDFGGEAQIAFMIDNGAFGPEVSDYAEIVADYWSRRKLRDALRKASYDVVTEKPVHDVVQQISDNCSELTQKTSKGDWVASNTQAVLSIVNAMEGGVTAKARYGISALDKRTGGLYGGDLVVLAGRPSMGKTAAANFIAAAQDHDKVVGVFNLEMTNDQQGQRFASLQYLLATGCQLPYTDIRRGIVPDNQRFVEQFKYAMQQAPEVFWRSMPRASLTQINAATRELKRRKGRLDLLIIDYLQLMEFPQARNGNRASDIGDVTSQLKALAVDLDVPVVLLSQLSRGVEQRDNKRPILSDLRDSGSIEQDADTVHFCFREHYYLEREGEPKDKSRIEEYEHRLMETQPQFLFLTPKQRMGRIGDDLVYWDAAHGAFYPDRSMSLQAYGSAAE